MKSNNPNLKNTPLRLTPAQTENPKEVFTDFFQSYHLEDVRQIMWSWLTEAVSSPHSHSSDHHERNNYMFFYEKMEALVEAAWIMDRGSSQITNANQASEMQKNEPTETNRKTGEPARYSKPARLIEKAATEPAAAIDEVFSHTPFDELQSYLLPNWLRVALINNMSPYTAAIDRENLYEFYDQLLLFVEALYCSETDRHYTPAYLNEEQLADPSLVITSFFQQFSMNYIRRELTDFLEAGIGYEGNYPNGFTPWQAWMTHNYILCLTEAAYRLHMDQQKQAVMNAHAELMMELEEVA